MELELPIQLVHEAGREAVVGTGFGGADGFWVARDSVTHVAVGTIVTTLFPRAPTNALNGYPETWDQDKKQCWLYGMWGVCTDDADLLAVRNSLVRNFGCIGPSDALGTYPERQLLLYATVSTDSCLLWNSQTPVIPYPLLMMEPPGHAVSNGPFLRLSSIADGAGTMEIIHNALLWVGAKGTPPPFR